ncbi:MAG: hypothetical protein AAFY72_12390 [Cyanobacteria bacterium J06649_4]
MAFPVSADTFRKFEYISGAFSAYFLQGQRPNKGDRTPSYLR